MDEILNRYTYRIEWSEEDQCFLAKCLEFPSLITHGPTRQKALEELDIVLQETLKWMEEEGEFPPKPISTCAYRGNISLRIPPQTHRDLTIRAAEENISINQLITTLIEKNLYSNKIDDSIEKLDDINQIFFNTFKQLLVLQWKHIKNFYSTPEQLTYKDMSSESSSATLETEKTNEIAV